MDAGSRPQGAGPPVGPQASGGPPGRAACARALLAGAWLGLALAACSAAGPEPPRPTPIPADAERLEAPELPEPGVELRSAADRAGVDVEHYDLALDLGEPDSGRFRGTATLRVRVPAGASRIPLDFAGLQIQTVEVDGEPASHRRLGALLTVGPFDAEPAPTTREVRVTYAGTPEDGLFFGEDARGDPAVFADNWPNRARWWFPANDHPSDKATVVFEVTVPDDFAVIANGALAEIRPVQDGATWVWRTDPGAPIPPYTMVIGVARFDRRRLGGAACGAAPLAPAPEGPGERCADVSAWALAGGGDYGAERFARAPDMLDFYTELVGPYPYEKLAHVQSSTRFGGMENASAIFYARGGWEEGRMGEGVIAHETAHQWFGDAVTPDSWYELWVSEGFASYFGPLYFEARDGIEAFRAIMERSRAAVVGSDVIGQAIVDSSTNRLFDLLNPNNYQKGAWVLHMLRHELGDEAFFRGIRDYYLSRLHGTGDTDAVQAALEAASGRELDAFFDRWVRSPGVPWIEIAWGPVGGDLVIDLAQTQPAGWPTFDLTIELEIERADGTKERAAAALASRTGSLRVPGAADAVALVFDPDVELLARAEVARRGR